MHLGVSPPDTKILILKALLPGGSHGGVWAKGQTGRELSKGGRQSTDGKRDSSPPPAPLAGKAFSLDIADAGPKVDLSE